MATKIRINKNKISAVLISGSDLTISSVAEMKKELLDLFSKVNSVELDMKNAERIDVAFLQLLCSSHSYAVRESKLFTFKRPVPIEMQALILESGFLRHVGCCNDRKDSCLWLAEAVDE